MNNVYGKNEVRTFPTRPDFVGEKKINDIIYGFYQTNSYLTEDKRRYCWKKDVSASKIIEYFKSIDKNPPVCERTIRDINKLLIAIGIFEEGTINNKKVYFLKDLQHGKYVYIKTNTLQYLVNTATSNVIKTYAFLKMKQQQHIDMGYEEAYRFSKVKILEILGYNYGRTKSEQLKMVDDVLTCLENNDLIRTHKCWIATGNDNVSEYYVLDAVNEDYKEKYKSKSKKIEEPLPYPIAPNVAELIDLSKPFRF